MRAEFAMDQKAASNGPTYRIDVCSPPEYEELVAEIYIDGAFVALLSQEQGPQRTMIEWHAGSQDSAVLQVPLGVFEAALAEAKQQLDRLERRRC